MEEIKCIFCETVSSHAVIEENGYQGKRCPQCGLIYISPRPSLEEIVDLYGHDSAHISAESHIANAFSMRLYARHHLRIIRRFVKSGALLEIGAGAGYFLDEARHMGYSPYGLEFNPTQANFIRNELDIPCEESPLSESTFDGKKFDVVYHCDVISHFFDPISEFRRINRILNDNAFLIFETGNVAEVDQRYFKDIQPFQYPDHLFFFGVGNLVDLLERSGFKFIKLYRYSLLPELAAISLSSGVKNLIKNYVLKSNGKEKPSSDRSSVEGISHGNANSLKAQSIIKNSIRQVREYINYILRYEIGHLAPKVGRPQTVIVVAKKEAGANFF